MYTAEFNKDGSLKHSADCRMVFGRKDANCPRCAEMLAGAAPRSGWQKAYFAQPSNDQRRCSEIREHFASHKHQSGGCGVVCTSGEW